MRCAHAQSGRRQAHGCHGALIAGSIGIFVMDIFITLGIAAAVPYVIIVSLSGRLASHRAPLLFGLLTTLLTVTGFFFSPHVDDLWPAMVNRVLALVIIWGTVYLTSERRRVEDALADANAQLRQQASYGEALVSGVMQYIPEGITTINEAGIIDSVNASVEELFGYTSKELRGNNVSMLMPEPYRSQHDEYIASYLRTGKGQIIDTGPREVIGVTRDGTEFELELNVGRMDVDGEVMFIGITRDITEREETERRRQETNKLQALGQLTGGVAHDFDDVCLTVISGNLDLMNDQVEPGSEIEMYLNESRTASQRAADLIRHLLAYARKQVLKPEQVDVNQLVAQSMELMQRTLLSTVEIETDLDDGLWSTVVDPIQLESCILNLAINARHAMPEGGKLTIETANARLDRGCDDVTPGQYIMIAITDTGTGIPREVLDKIFDPFFTTKPEGKGTGLGLSMVYGFVKQSAGHVIATSRTRTRHQPSGSTCREKKRAHDKRTRRFSVPHALPWRARRRADGTSATRRV
ncbi:MAG: PAS domain S-box protein [Gammaproteobacteria bacterium]|nr:PAS domain S-box protein [Gammaproteobacteria bacterium]